MNNNEPIKSKLIISVDILIKQGYSTKHNTNIGLLTRMFLSCMAHCEANSKSWHDLYVKDTNNYRYVCTKCNSTVTYVG